MSSVAELCRAAECELQTVVEHRAVIDGHQATRLRHATNDESQWYETNHGLMAPPTFGLIIARTPLTESVALWLERDGAGIQDQGLVLLEMRIDVRGLLRFGELATTQVGVGLCQQTPLGLIATAHIETCGQSSNSMSLSTIRWLFPGMSRLGAQRRPLPRLTSRAARQAGRRVVRTEIDVAPDQALRYAEASGDDQPIHQDAEAARALGFRGVIVHGMCVLTMVGVSATEVLADGDPSRLAHLAGRFARPVHPGDRITTSFEQLDADTPDVRPYAFTANVTDGLAITHGRVGITPPAGSEALR